MLLKMGFPSILKTLTLRMEDGGRRKSHGLQRGTLPTFSCLEGTQLRALAGGVQHLNLDCSPRKLCSSKARRDPELDKKGML